MDNQNAKLTPYSLFIVIGVGLFAALFAVEKVYNYDLWWHLRSGQWILDNMAIPYVDTFSFSTTGDAWVNSSWLFGPIYVALYDLGGVNLLILFKALLIGLSFSLACLFLVRRGVHPFLAAILLGYAVVVIRFRFLLRPIMVMFPAVIACFWVLTGPASRSNRAVFWMVPLVIVWANLNASVYIVPVFSLFLLIEAFWCRYFVKDEIPTGSPSIRFALHLTIALSLAVLVTPYGLVPAKLMFSRAIVEDLLTNKTAIEEHLPLVWGTYQMYWALLIGTGISYIVNYKKIRIFHLLIYMSTAFLSLSSVRYIGIAAFFQAIFLGLNLQNIFEDFKPKIFLTGKVAKVFSSVVLIFFGWYAFHSSFLPNKVYKWGLGINQSRYPVSAVKFLKDIGFSGSLYNLWEQGGYVLWHLPEVRTLVDGRSLESQFSLLAELGEMDLIEFMIFLKKFDVRGALLHKKNEATVEVFQTLPGYSLKYFDEDYLVYLRNDLEILSKIVPLESFQYIKPQVYNYSYLDSYAKQPTNILVETELRRAVELSPNNFATIFQLAYFLELLNKVEALDVYLKAAEINSALAFSHFNLGLQAAKFAIKQHSWEKAINFLLMAIDQGQDDARHNFLLGTVYYKVKQYVSAETSFMKVLRDDPNHIATLQNLGYMFLDTGRLKDAEGCFEKATKLAPESESVLYGYILTLHRLQRPEVKEFCLKYLDKFSSSRWSSNVKKILEGGSLE